MGLRLLEQMKYLVLLLLFTTPRVVLADFVAGIGLDYGTGISTDEKALSGPSLLDTNGLIGPRGDFEIGFKRLTLAVFGSYTLSTATSQYRDNVFDTTINDVDTAVGVLRFGIGPRLYLVNSNPFRMFVGGGVQYGALALRYDPDQIDDSNGFESDETQQLNGSYLEAGMDYIFKNKYGVRALWQRSSLKSGDFSTLGDKSLSFKNNSISLNYIQYVNTNW